MGKHLRATVALLALAPAVAFAHTGHGDTGNFLGGLLHPLSGLDHALTMIAAGSLAWSLGRCALWMLPAGFASMMSGGWLLAQLGIVLPQAEIAVGASVAAMGLLLLAGRRLPAAVTLGLVGAFGILHGNAHGAELLAGKIAAHASGFLLATVLLHAAGMGLAAAITRARARLAAARRESRTADAQPSAPHAGCNR